MGPGQRHGGGGGFVQGTPQVPLDMMMMMIIIIIFVTLWPCCAIGHGDTISESIISGLLGGFSHCVISDMSSASGLMASMLHGSSARASLSGMHSISQQASPNACLISSLFISESLTVSGGSQGMEVLGMGLWCEWKKSHIIHFFPSAHVFLIASWTSFLIALQFAACRCSVCSAVVPLTMVPLRWALFPHI